MTKQAQENKPRLRLMGKKLGMTQRFDEKGWRIPCTVIVLQNNTVTQVKTEEVDGYSAVQIAAVDVSGKKAETIQRRVKKPQRGLFDKEGLAPKKKFQESRVDTVEGYQIGQVFNVEQFSVGDFLDVSGVSKGKGYQGVMKRHNFAGGPASHGSGFHRHGGSTGMRSTPGRCLPGQKKAGQMGNEKVTVQNLQVIEVLPEESAIIVRGAIPGANGSIVSVSTAVKKRGC